MERRDFFKMTGGLAGAALLTSCTRSSAATPPSPGASRAGTAGGMANHPAHVLYADVSANLSAIDAGSGSTILSTAGTVPSATWDSLYTVSPAGELLTLDARTGKEASRTPVPPGVVVRTVSMAGTVVALGTPPPASPYGGPGRRVTTLVIADPTGQKAPKVMRLDGNFEPDSFSTDGTVLFLLEYLPATAPESYRVKAYDIHGEGAFTPLLTRNKTLVPKGAEETMRGDGRVAVLSPGYERLYTLYTHQPNHLHTRDLIAGKTKGVHAFVHVLDLGQRWAYCLDLPEPFGRGPAEGHALAVSPDSLYVYDGSTGTMVEATTDSLEIKRTASIGTSTGGASAATADGSLYIAAGPSLKSVDRSSLALRSQWRLPSPARGVAVGLDDGSVYAGVTDGVVRFDGREGRELSRLEVRGISELRYVAPQPTG